MDAYENLCAMLKRANVPFRIVEHEAEGQTEAVSRLRGHPINQAAKCIILILKFGKRHTRFVLAVVRGDARLDTGKVKAHFGATYAGFAAAEVAERLAGSPIGTVLPFAISEELTLIVDPGLLQEPEFYFNAGRLDRSLAMKPADYAVVAKPAVADIATYTPPSP